MDRQRRYNLRRVVGEARRLIEDEIAKRLAYYGVRADGTTLPLSRLPHLTADDRDVRVRLDAAIHKEESDRLDRDEATARYIRNVGFTCVNRFAALQAMEVRGFLSKETMVRRAEYGGRSLHERDIAEAHPELSPDDVLRLALEEAFAEAGEQIGVLFDLTDEYSLVFPAPRACRELIRLFTEEVPAADWREDDVIGWVYQYYNEEARAEFKKSRRKPSTDDIPVINQFYTPHWVVRVLTDNTLGRLWLEMQSRCPVMIDGDPSVVNDPRLGVPDPKADPGRFAGWLRDPASATLADTVDTFCSYLVPLQNNSPQRPAKPVEEIKILDPACGSGHFLVYAFDVLYRIWREARPDLPAWQIPALILEHNLHGIDIDLRAVQLAALSLYLKARTTFEEALVSERSARRPEFRITRLNLVVADARIPADGLRTEFLRRFSADRDLQALFATLFEYLNHTNELGSLLKVRQPFEQLFERRYAQAQRRAAAAFEEGQTVLPGMKVQPDLGDAMAQAVTREQAIAEMTERAMAALKEFEAEAMAGQDMGSQLFATEAEKSMGLLALLSLKYDVVLMNPPYGAVPPKAKKYLRRHYPRTHTDYYAAFIEQVIDLGSSDAYVGMLTPRAFMFLKWMKKVREELLLKDAPPQLLLDLGFGVLDGATVETAATVLGKTPSLTSNSKSMCTFCRLSGLDSEEKQRGFERPLSEGLDVSDTWYSVQLAELSRIPASTFAYWASDSLRRFFTYLPPLDRDGCKRAGVPKMANVKQGLTTADDKRFVRRFWEVGLNRIGVGGHWVPFAKGGGFIRYHGNIALVVNWENGGREIYEYNNVPFGSSAAPIRNPSLYFREGITYSNVTVKPFSARFLPKGCIFSHVGQAVFPGDRIELFALLGFLNSSLVQTFFHMLGAVRHYEVGQVSALPIKPAGVRNGSPLAGYAREAHDLQQIWDTGNETSTIFVRPWLLQALHPLNPAERPITGHPFAEQFEWADWPSLQAIRTVRGSPEMSLRELAKLCIRRRETTDARVAELQAAIDEEVYRLYSISDEDRALIERELALRQGGSVDTAEEEEESPDLEEQVDEFDLEAVADAEEQVREHVRRLLSFHVRQSVEADSDGIVPLDTAFDDNLLGAVHRRLAADFGQERLLALEDEIAEILGKPLERWLVEDYFEYHVNLYKRRPIFWQLTSERLGRRRHGGVVFSCLLHYHRLTRDTLPKVQAFYLRDVRERAGWERNRLRRELESVRVAGDRVHERDLRRRYEAAANRMDELDALDAALTELHNPRREKYKLPKQSRWVDEKIAEVRDNGWTPVIDYGVRVNIEPLKEVRVLPKAADRVK